MQGQIDTDVEWAIVVTEGENVTPPTFWGDYDHRPDLFDREFIHNAQDCLAFVSDWYYKEFKIKLGLFPRDFYWFEDGKNHLEEQYKAWGFEVIPDSEPQKKGDIVMYSIQSKVTNHVGVITEPHRVAHHLYNRFPKSEPYEIWSKYITKRLRHATNPGKQKGEQQC
jgi:cell wall-associated NlpC family hydrolase